MRVQPLDDKTAHTVHRIEAFSDIVIGFCLAQLGLNLVLPRAATDATSVWANSTFFIGAFVFIALLWWLHHRTFSTYFVLNTPMILMNFAMLGGLIITLYFFESVVHVAATGQSPVVFFELFVFAFAFVYAMLGGMLAAGLILRRTELAPSDLRWGIGQIVSVVLAVLFFAYLGGYSLAHARRGSIVYIALAAAVTVFVVRRIILPRWLRQAIPDAPVET
jgi:uncharacterized membrane protein